MRPQVGQLIQNKYRLIRAIGDGGMGSVFEARHEVLGTTVAIKFLHPELTRRSGLVQRFLQEAQTYAKIQSRHVVQVIDVEQTSAGLAFIVMEYLEGRTLQTLYEDLYRAGQRLSYADALEYAMQMLEGVEAAHRIGAVHRDLKPDNVMITKGPKGEPLLKLLDFGIAKVKADGQAGRGLTRAGVIMGTPEYMAPEQAFSADTADATADVFALGVMIFEMLAGRRPVGGDEPQQIATAYMTGQIARLADLVPGIAPELAAAVQQAIAGQPKDRFPSVAEFRAKIEPFALAVRPQAAAGATPMTPPPGGATPSPAVFPSPANSPIPAMSPVPAPPTNAPNDGYRAVPKTLPPDGDAPPAGVGPGGMPAAYAPHPGLAGFDASPMPQRVSGADGAFGMQPGMAVAPMTASGDPFAQHAAPAYPAAGFEGAGRGAPVRAGGTALSGASFPAGQGGYPGVPAPYGAAPVPYGSTAPGTAPDPLPPVPARAGRKAAGVSLVFIFMLAAGVAGTVTGGVYLWHRMNKGDERADVDAGPLPTPTVTIIPSAPPGPIATTPPPTTPVATRPPPTSRPTSPSNTNTKPTSSSPTSSLPSGFPTSIPMPPWVPSNLPLPFPFPPTQQQGGTSGGDSSGGSSTGGNPNPPPTTTRPKINIPVPRHNP
jgi:serine/threonine-protein kinase